LRVAIPIHGAENQGVVDPVTARTLLDEDDTPQLLAQVTPEEVGQAWCRYAARNAGMDEHAPWDEDPDGWAAELYYEDEFKANETYLRRFLATIVDAASDEVLGWVGAGPLEDFLADDDDRLAWVEEQAARSERFQQALSHVWIDSWAHDELFQRVEAAASLQLSWSEFRGPRPGERDLSRPTPEEAALAWFRPHQMRATPVGSRIEGDESHVWLLTQYVPTWFSRGDEAPMRWDPETHDLTADPVPFAEYEATCVREGDAWRRTHGRSGFSPQVPDEIRARANAMKGAS
jgi:hypothetical protein